MNDKSVLNPIMLELLVEWEESKVSGAAVSLEELCAQCPDQIDELRRHVTRITHVESLFDQVEADSPPLLPGFEQLEEIGRGGMGVVYKARDVQLDQIVAIKVPFGSQGVGNSRKRFERETKTLAKLRHKNIVQVRSAGYADESPYLVMDYVPGGNLAERMQDVAGEPMQAARLISQVARAVDHAHRAGIIHRDLKPGNILLSDEGEPLVSDFGVAAVLLGEPLQSRPAAETPNDRHSAQDTRITNSAAVGTPAYLPPEAHLGAAASVAAATDVWSLGVILYECLTGQTPYSPPSPELEKGIRDYATPPPKPSSIRRGVPRALELIIQRCLAIDPARRYATAGAIADDLERWLSRVELKQRLKKVAFYGVPTALVLLLTAFVFWPPSPAVRHEKASRASTAELHRSGTLQLVGPQGPPKTFLVRTNQAITTTDVSPAGIFYVDGARPCLLELLREVPKDHFLFTAELRQLTGGKDSDLGLYFGHAFLSDIPYPGHRFLLLQFSDVGQSSARFTGPDKTAGSGLILSGVRYDPLGQPALDPAFLNMQWYPSHGFAPGPWRKVTVEVSLSEVIGMLDGYPPLKAPPYAVHASALSPHFPQGGLGLYVNNCKVEIRNCRITLLTHPQ